MSNHEKPAVLKIHEWLAVVILISLVGGLALITSFPNTDSHKKNKTPSFIKKEHDGVRVLIKGAVTYPGIYQLPSEMLLGDVLDIAQVNSNADLRRYKLDRKLSKGRVINIPIRKMITIHLKGAVKLPGAMRVPKGTALADLESMVEFSDNADRNALRKQRKLKDNEVVVIKEVLIKDAKR